MVEKKKIMLNSTLDETEVGVELGNNGGRHKNFEVPMHRS